MRYALKQNYKPGELLMMSQGCYSDYRVDSLLRVIRPFNMKNEAEEHWNTAPTEYGEERNEHTADYEINCDSATFATWLVTRGLCEEVPHLEIHCGSYFGDFKSEFIAGFRKSPETKE